MWYRNLIVFACLSLLVAGCSSSPDVEDELPAEEPSAADEPRAQNVTQAYEDAARWLPADSIAVYIQSSEPFWDQIGELALPMANPDAEPESAGTLEGLQEDMAELSRHYFGFDTWKLDTIVAAIDGQGGIGVAFGDVDEPVDLPTAEVAGESVYVIDLSAFMEDEIFTPDVQELADQGLDPDAVSNLYLLPIDEPRTGFVGALRTSDLERLIIADEADTLVGSDAGEAYADFFSSTEGAELAFAASLERGERALADLGEEIPQELDEQLVEWVSFSYGDALKLTMRGDQHLLQNFESRADEIFLDIDEMTQEFVPMLAGTFYGDLALAYVQHKTESISSQAKPQWLNDDTLRYELALSGGHLSRTWGVSSVAVFFTVPLIVMGVQSFFDAPPENLEIDAEHHEDEPHGQDEAKSLSEHDDQNIEIHTGEETQ